MLVRFVATHGTAGVRLDDITLRPIAYHAGFAAAHWCKGHILYVVAGKSAYAAVCRPEPVRPSRTPARVRTVFIVD